MQLEKRYEMLKKRLDRVTAENKRLRETVESNKKKSDLLDQRIQEIEKIRNEWQTMLRDLKNKYAECEVLHSQLKVLVKENKRW